MLIIFDSFGVLLTKGLQSSIHKLTDVLARPEKEIARVYRKWELLYDSGEIEEDEFWANFNKELGTDLNGDILRNIILSSYQLKSETVALIKELRRQYTVVLYSNYRKAWFDHLDNKYQLSELFDQVFISSETGLLKPDPKAFELVMNSYHSHPSETILLDDELPNIRSFNKLGGNGVVFNNAYEAEIKLRQLCDLQKSYDDYYSGILLRTTNGNLILQRRDTKKAIENSGKLSVFGGRREGEESPIDCALRELEEETSIVAGADQMRLIFQCAYPARDESWTLCHYYLLDNVNVNNIHLREGQNIEIWKPVNALKQQDLTTIPRIVIQKLVQEKL